MKKGYTRAAMTVLMVAAILIILLAATTVTANADTYYLENPLPVNTEKSVKWGSTYDANAITYIKIKPTKTGIIKFTTNFFCYVTLCDNNRKVLSRGSDTSGDYIDINNTNSFMQKVYYGVKKGKTYQLKIVNMPNFTTQASDGYYYYIGKLKWTNSKISPSKKGSSKKKAKAIKKNKKIKGLFVGGNKKAQWFKITNKQKKTKIYIAAPKQNYRMKFRVYYKSGKKWKSVATTLSKQTDYSKDVFTGTINKKIKHTYYIKVTPEAKSSGTYTIKWK